MSCNNYLSYYSLYSGYPGVCGTSYYNRNLVGNCCNSCNTTCFPCQTICNPCATTCTPPACPNVTYITVAPTVTTIPTGGMAIPAGVTTIPSATVTVINGFTGSPTTNVGGIILNTANGQFTIPISGRYLLSGFISFTANTTGTRETYIYKIDSTTGVISLLTSDTRNATSAGVTSVTITTVAELNAGNQIFFAVTQSSGSNLNTTTDNKFVIARLL